MYDIIGDVHGCYEELLSILLGLGYENESSTVLSHYRHPEGRQAVFVGDLTDRGPGSPKVLNIVMNMVESETALCVMGNHDNKLMRYLKGNKIKINNGLQSTIDQLKNAENRWWVRASIPEFLKNLPYQIVLDEGRLHVSHAGLQEKYHGVDNKKTRAKAMYGVTTGKTLPNGFPERIDWAKDYSGKAICVHGHVRLDEVRECNKVWNVDTSCVYGNMLSALRYPELEVVSVPAFDDYHTSSRPF